MSQQETFWWSKWKNCYRNTKQLHKEGATIVVVTHDLDVGNVAERKIILEYGKIVDVIDQKQYGKKNKIIIEK